MLLSLILSEQLERTVNQGAEVSGSTWPVTSGIPSGQKPDSEYVTALLRATELFDVHSIILGPDNPPVR